MENNAMKAIHAQANVLAILCQELEAQEEKSKKVLKDAVAIIQERDKAKGELIAEKKENQKIIEMQSNMISELQQQLKDEKKHSKSLLFELNRALEVIRGNELDFECEIVEAEYQKMKPIEFDGKEIPQAYLIQKGAEK